MSLGGPLSRRDFDDVIRRASELADEESGRDEGEFTDADAVRIGRDVGLPERHVRRALAEHRANRRRGPRRGVRPLLALARTDEIRASRTVERPRRRIRREIDEFMVAGQLLQRVRRRDDLLQYRPSVDWVSRVARAASLRTGKHYVATARRVEVRLEAASPQSTLVAIQVDPGMAGRYRGQAGVGGAGVGLALAAGVGAPLALIGSLALAIVASATVGVAGAALAAAAAGRAYRRRIEEVRAEVEGILDGLESREGLTPPPPAWRRWVRRRFHGVARETTTFDRGERAWRSEE